MSLYGDTFKYPRNLCLCMRAVVDQDITPRDALLDPLPDGWDTTVGLESTPEAVRRELETADIAFVTSRIPITRRTVESAEGLQVVGKLGTGIDNIDQEAAAANEITVTHTPGYNALSVAEHTLCLTLATLRRLPQARALVSSGAWRDEFPLANRLSGSTVGIVGFGNVGRRFGTLLSGFDIELLAHDPYVPAIETELVGGEMTTLDDLLNRSDVVVVTAQLTDETYGLIGHKELSKLAPHTVLVNTARGPVVQREALIDALENDAIGGVGLDVFWEEPPDESSPILSADNVVYTPHVAAATEESRTESIEQLVENVQRLLTGDSVSGRFVAVPPA